MFLYKNNLINAISTIENINYVYIFIIYLAFQFLVKCNAFVFLFFKMTVHVENSLKI